MYEIQCPRCEQYWYDNDEKRGRARLCDRCADHLRRKRRLIDAPFLIVTALLLFLDGLLIALSVLKPSPFAKVMLVYGALVFLGGLIPLRGFRLESGLEGYLPNNSIDWKFGRWPLLIAISGMVCIFASLVWIKK